MQYKVKNIYAGEWVIVSATSPMQARMFADEKWRTMDHGLRGFHPNTLDQKRTDVSVRELAPTPGLTNEDISTLATDMSEAVEDASYPYGDEGAGYDYDDAVRLLIAKGYKIIPPSGVTTEVEDYRKRVVASLRENAVNLAYEGADMKFVNGIDRAAERIEEGLV